MDTTTKNNFFNGVYEIVKQIPRGKVISYGQIATLLGNPRAARTVGWAMSTCPEDLPWQRVVMADGSITGGQWETLRRELLHEEDVEFLANGKVNMKTCTWNPS